VHLESLRVGFGALSWLFGLLAVGFIAILFSRIFTPSTLVGLLAALVLLLVAITLSRWVSWQLFLLRITSGLQRRYARQLNFLPRTVEIAGKVVAPFLSIRPIWHSKQELLNLLAYHQKKFKVLSTGEQQQLSSLLSVETRTVDEMSMPIRKALLISSEDTIGPLLLQDLHENPYSAFLVYEGKRTNIVGVLEQGVALSHAKRSTKVASLMNERVIHLPIGTTYLETLQTFIGTTAALAIIVDEDNKPISVIYLRDILIQLFGNGA
jgi:CBS domain containing-hemolysin-like protein